MVQAFHSSGMILEEEQRKASKAITWHLQGNCKSQNKKTPYELECGNPDSLDPVDNPFRIKLNQ
jgi:hypothetical protein